MSKYEELDEIATTYHLNSLPDMHIEEAAQRFELKWVVSALPSNSSSVLDLGYGDGIIFSELIQHGQITLIEGSAVLCSAAEKVVFSSMSQYDHSIENVLFEDFHTPKRFNAIVASHVLEHVEDPRSLLKHLRSLLGNDGILIGIVPNSESLHRRLGVQMGLQAKLDDLSPRDHLVGHKRVYSRETLERDLNAAGLEVLELRGFMVKVLANSQMLHLDSAVLQGLLEISNQVPAELCANLGFIATSK